MCVEPFAIDGDGDVCGVEAAIVTRLDALSNAIIEYFVPISGVNIEMPSPKALGSRIRDSLTPTCIPSPPTVAARSAKWRLQTPAVFDNWQRRVLRRM